MEEPTLATTYKLPILPAIPTKALEGKEITQEMIDSALAYDPTFRPSYVYLNEDEAHNRAGKSNGEVLAQILRTFKEGGHVIAEVLPQRKYKENGKFEELAAPDGSHPGRSVDLWSKKLIPGCQTDFYLEGIALCGAQKPATVNLPAIYYSTQFGLTTVTFSINTGLTGEGQMENQEQKVDLTLFQKQIDDLKTQFAADKETLVAERDHYKSEFQNLSTEFQKLNDKVLRQEVEQVFRKELAGKIKSDEYDKRFEFAITLKKESKERYEDYIDSLKARPVVVELTSLTGGIPNQMAAGGPSTQNEAINLFAAENNLNRTTEEGFNAAERGAMAKYPHLWKREGAK